VNETRDPQSVVDAAEQAAAAGDYASAERLLREAAVFQEASLGSRHPDLANTLNNLGIVCEIAKKPEDAEAYFRKACAIATATLPPDHPFVAMSRKNLEDFCAVWGRAVDPPPASPVADDLRLVPTSPVDPSERLSYEVSPPAASARRTSPRLIGTLVAGGLVLVLILITVTWLRSRGEVASSSGTPTVSRGTPSTQGASPPAGPVAPEAVKETAPARPKESPVPPTAAAERQATPESAPPPSVAAAQLCRDLSTGASRGDWTCVPAGLPVAPGSLFFYTRLKSPAATTVQHRWYRGDRLHQVVELTIRPNTTEGFRTYSRDTIDTRGPADWRVELRTRSGVLLHEERFAVR
jgi:hypothetical protein